MNNIVNFFSPCRFSFSLSLSFYISLMFNHIQMKRKLVRDIVRLRSMLFPRKYSILLVRRNETICCLIGFGIGIGCCILYRIISNLLNPAASIAVIKRDVSNKWISLDCQDHFLFISRRKSPKEKR